MQATAIVVAYRSADVIRRCVLALLDDPAVAHVLVSNNSPGDYTRAAVRNLPRTTLVENSENIGFGRAVNSVRQRIAEAYIVLANPDAVQRQNTISQTIDFLETHGCAAIVGPRMITASGDLYLSSQHNMTPLRMVGAKLGVKRLGVERTLKEHGRPHRTDYVIGSFAVCRRASLDQIGWFDENIFLFGEDQDLCRRIREQGWEVWYAPIGEVEHKRGHSWRQLDDAGRGAFTQARIRELRKCGHPLAARIYALLIQRSGRVS